MIANITKGRRAVGGLIYDFGPGHREEHVDARFVAGNVPGTRQQVGRLIDHHARQADAARPIWRCSLSLPDEDGVLPDQTWGSIAEEFVAEMGFADCPWVAVRHGDDHIHLTVSRVAWDGTIASDQWDYRRARKVADALEARYGLVAARDRFKEAGPGPRSGAELAAAQRRGQDKPEREQLRDAVRAARAVSTGNGRAVFEQVLANAGVGFRANVASTDRMNGYSFALPGWTNGNGEPIWVKASELGKDLAWSKLGPVLGTASTPVGDGQPQPGDGSLAQQSAQLREQTEQALAEARAQVQAEASSTDLAHRTLDAYAALSRGERPEGAEGDYELAPPTLPRIEQRRYGLLGNTELDRRLAAAVKDVAYKEDRHRSLVERSRRMDAALAGTAPWDALEQLVERRAALEAAAEHLRQAAEHDRRAAEALALYRAAQRVADDSTAAARKSNASLWLRGTNKDQQRGFADLARAQAQQHDAAWRQAIAARDAEKEAARRVAPSDAHNIPEAWNTLARNWPQLVAQAQAQDRAFVAKGRPVAAADEEYARQAAERARRDVADLTEEQRLRTVMPADWAEREATARGQAATASRTAGGRGAGGRATGPSSGAGGSAERAAAAKATSPTPAKPKTPQEIAAEDFPQPPDAAVKKPPKKPKPPKKGPAQQQIHRSQQQGRGRGRGM